MKRLIPITLTIILALSIVLTGCTPETPEVPEAPTGLNCIAVSGSQIDLSWDASAGADDYYIYRCEGASCTPTTKVHTASGTSWSDTALSLSTSYCYIVTAHNEAGESDYSATTCCTTQGPAPEAPTGLNCIVVSISQIDLSWDASAGATGYNVYRCTGTDCTPTAPVYTGPNTFWSDTGLNSSTTYCYGITAYNDAGESGHSTTTCCRTYDNPQEAWSKLFGGSGPDAGTSVQQTSDGGYIITGSTCSYGAGQSDIWLIKTDSSGTQTWAKTFGGTLNDIGYSVQQTSDGGYILTGYTNSYGAGNYDVWLIKTDFSGTQAWSKTFGDTGDDRGYSVQQTSDGGYILTGYTNSYGAGNYDVWLIKTDSSGNQTWAKTFGGTGGDIGYSVQQTPDGGYIITGGTSSYGAGSTDVWLIKTDSSGTETWSDTFGDTGVDVGHLVQQTSDDGYIITGYTNSYGAGSIDVWLIKTDSSGTGTWSDTFGGTGEDYGYSVQQTSDDGYIITGYTNSYGAGNYDVWLIKTDFSGTQAWSKTFGDTGDDKGHSVQQTPDGGYIITGYKATTLRDVWLIKVSV